MAMLAEPRRKQKIGPNPRGLFFTEDDQNRGRTMLQKMGWKDGSGLGLTHQGISEPIKPKVQQNSKGLGFDVKVDPWVAHIDNFSDLLQNLNSTSEGIVGSGVDRSELEKRSKSSRSRIHYQKFVRNKDLSNCSAKDWNCIFGKSVDTEPLEKTDDKPVVEAPGEIEESVVTLKDKFVGGGSMLDYFKQKFEEKLKRAQNIGTDTTTIKDAVESQKSQFFNEDTLQKKGTHEFNQRNTEFSTDEQTYKVDTRENDEPLKKKKKNKTNNENLDYSTEEPLKKTKKKKTNTENLEDDTEEPKKTKKKDKTNTENLEDDTEEPPKKKNKTNTENQEDDTEEPKNKKKKNKTNNENLDYDTEEPIRKKKKDKTNAENLDYGTEEPLKKKNKDKTNTENLDCYTEGPLKKKKKDENSTENLANDTDEPLKKKKKNKNNTENLDNDTEKPIKKKKKDKTNTENLDDDNEEPKKKKNKTNTENLDHDTEEPLKREKQIMTEEPGMDNNTTLEDEDYNKVRGRKKIWDEETVKHIASKYLGSNVLSIPGYPLSLI